jgi:hypothetical protein
MMNNQSELVREKLAQELYDAKLLLTKSQVVRLYTFILARDKKNGEVLADVWSKSINDNATYDAIEITLNNLGYNI